MSPFPSFFMTLTTPPIFISMGINRRSLSNQSRTPSFLCLVYFPSSPHEGFFSLPPHFFLARSLLPIHPCLLVLHLLTMLTGLFCYLLLSLTRSDGQREQAPRILIAILFFKLTRASDFSLVSYVSWVHRCVSVPLPVKLLVRGQDVSYLGPPNRQSPQGHHGLRFSRTFPCRFDI